MTAFLSVVQYVPDPVADERINVGVLVFKGADVRTRFIENWQRVRHFGNEDVGFLREFAEEAKTLDEKGIRKIAGSWNCSIRLTQPIGSGLDPDALLADSIKRYLRPESAVARAPYHTRSYAIGLTERTVRKALRETFDEKQAGELLKRDLPIKGKTGTPEFDVGAANGKPIFGARAISFEARDTKVLQREVESTAWALEDVRHVNTELPLAVVVLPPRREIADFYRQNQKLYQFATKEFSELKARVIHEAELSEWADEMAGVVADKHHRFTVRGRPKSKVKPR